jgi:hypothetical protein
MKELIPPLCLVLSLLLFIAAFTVLAIDKPQPSVELHRARVEADEQYRNALEKQLEQRRRQRWLLIVSLFSLAVIMAIVAYVVMRPSASN